MTSFIADTLVVTGCLVFAMGVGSTIVNATIFLTIKRWFDAAKEQFITRLGDEATAKFRTNQGLN